MSLCGVERIFGGRQAVCVLQLLSSQPDNCSFGMLGIMEFLAIFLIFWRQEVISVIQSKTNIQLCSDMLRFLFFSNIEIFIRSTTLIKI